MAIECLALQLLGFFFLFLDLGPVRPAFGLEDLDVVVIEGDEELLELARIGVGDRPDEILLGDVALLLPFGEKLLGLLAVLGVDPGALGDGGLGAGILLFGRALRCHSYS